MKFKKIRLKVKNIVTYDLFSILFKDDMNKI